MSGGEGSRPPTLSMGVPSFAADDPGSWEHLVARAEVLDRAGVDRLVVSDHVAFGLHMDAYARPEVGGQAGGRQPTGPDGHWLEPLTTLTYLAARTTRIRLGTNILIAALRRPAVLAKTAATLDVLSGGRLDLGVGVGWQREEYEACGLAFEDRGRLLDHSLEVCRGLWGKEEASYSSPELGFTAIHQMPKPVQPGGVPIWVSGTVNRRVARRLARFGTGWIPWGPAAADPTEAVPAMRVAVEAEGGAPDGFAVVGTLRPVVVDDELDAAATTEAVAALLGAGVTDVRASLRLGADPEGAEHQVRRLVGAFRAAT